MEKSVLIPVPLVRQIVDLLRCWDISRYDRSVCDDYYAVLRDLNIKLQKLEVREAYSNIISARNEYDRDDARIDYLRQKSMLADISNDDCIF